MAGHTLFPSITPTRPDVTPPTVDELVEGDYQTAVTAVRAGEVDAHLEELADRDDRATVQEAIADRRAQLKGDSDQERE